MKELFIAVTAQLSSLSQGEGGGRGLWIDMDKGQLNAKERPGVKFPCALVKVGITSIDEQGGGLKNNNATVTVRLAFDNAAGRTAEGTPEAAREQSLAYLDTAKAVFEAFRAFEPGDWSAFSARECVQEERSDGLVVIRMTWNTNKFE